MTVWIKEEEFKYTSDYPDGWKRAKGDFKFPVPIGRYKCFIKRFNRSPESISGWGLLSSLIVKIENGANYTMSKHEKNLPKVHDIVQTVEKNEKIHYVFLEMIEGETLSKMLSDHVEIDLKQLTEDLFSAFQSLNKYGFWFADFFEKNMCCDRRGNFYLVDLDSAQPTSKPPHIDMWGEKEYWALVFDFYRQILGRHNFTPSDISGTLLNYLQTIFLILRIKIYNSQRDKEYNEVNIHPSHLNKISPAFKEVFTKALVHESHESPQAFISEIKDLINEKIIQSSDAGHYTHEPTPHSEPVIKKFSITDYSPENNGEFIIESGKSFIINWEVENASDVQLYKNGQFFKKVQQDEESIELVEEVYDKDEKKMEFELVASQRGEVVSEVVTVIIAQGGPAINSFEVSNYSKKNGDEYEVEDEKKFILTWNVRNAESVKLYKNGNLLNEFSNEQNEVEVAEKIYDGRSKPIEYSLAAINGSRSETRTLIIHVKLSRSNPPIINDFKLVGNFEKKGGDYVVESNKPFTLSWNVENVTKAKLYRNGALLNEFSNNENKTDLSETFDSDKIVEYKLSAFNNSKETTSRSITVASVKMVVEFSLTDYAKKGAGNEYVVIKDKPFKLKWHVENVQNLGLLRNGKSYEVLSPEEEVLELRETVSDEEQTPVEYTLVASRGSEIQRRSVTVKVKTVKPAKPINWLYVLAAAIIIGIVITFAYYKLGKNTSAKKDITEVPKPPPLENTTINPITRDRISENDTLYISGENLPENDNAVQVLFNGVSGKIVHHTESSVNVLVPHVEGNNVAVTVKVNDTTFNIADNVPYHGKAPAPTRPVANSLQITQVLENSNITITGENLPTKSGSVSVKFNNATGTIIRQTPKKVVVKVPALPEGEPVDIVMKINGETLRVAKGLSFRKAVVTPPPVGGPVTLNPFNQGTITEDDIITIRGNNIPTEQGAVQVIFDGKVKFNIVEQTSTFIRVKVPTLALKSGIIAVKVKDKYIPLPNSLVNYKLH